MLSTVHLFEFCKLYNNMDVPFDLQALKASIEDEDELEDFMNIFLDPIYGTKSKLTYQDWCKKIKDEKSTHFVFHSEKFREVVFKKANL